MATSKQLLLGQGTSQLVQILAQIRGLGIHLGDASNTSETNPAVTQNARWGWGGTFGGFTGGVYSQRREIPFWYYALPSQLPKKSQIISAFLRLKILAVVSLRSGGFTDQPAPVTVAPGDASGAWKLDLHGVRLNITSGMNWRQYDGTNYFSQDYGPHPGDDYLPDPCGTSLMQPSQYAAVHSAAYYEWPIEVSEEVQYCSDAGLPLRLVMPIKQPPPDLTATAGFHLQFDQPGGSDHLNNAHTYLEVNFRPGLAFFRPMVAASRPLDLNGMLIPTSQAQADHLYLETPEESSSSGPFKYYVRANRIGGTRRRITITAGRADISSVSQLGSVSGKTLRSIDVFDNATGDFTPSGTLRVGATSGTGYKLYLSPADGSGEVQLSEQTLGTAEVPFASTGVFVYSTLRAFRIRPEKWSGTTALAGDTWRATSRADLRPSGYSASTLGLVYIMPHQVSNTDEGDQTVRRLAQRAFTQQFWQSPVNEDQGGGVFATRIWLRDTTGLVVGQKATISDKDCTPARIVEVEVSEVRSSTDGDTTKRDSILIVGTVTVANYDGQSVFTTGLMMGNLQGPKESRLDVAAEAGDTQATLTTPLTGPINGVTITFIDVTPGVIQNEDTTGSSQVGYELNLSVSTPLLADYPAGSLVIANESLSNKSWFIMADVPGGTALGQYLGYLRMSEMVVY